jgi:hypothetical protein
MWSKASIIKGVRYTFGRKYKYYVAYSFKNKLGHGIGCTEILSEKPLKTFEDIIDTARVIKEKSEFDSVIITYYSRIK